jgi:hypothetical protein
MVIPNDEVVDAFEYYRKNFSSKAFNRDMRLYSMDYLAFPELADSLWLCIFSRLMIQNQPRINKSPLESEYEDLISNEKYLTAKLKSLKEDQDNVIKRVSSKFDGKNLNDIITECELEGITNTKEIIHRAFEEGLILPKRLGKAYMRAYRHRSDLNLVF